MDELVILYINGVPNDWMNSINKLFYTKKKILITNNLIFNPNIKNIFIPLFVNKKIIHENVINICPTDETFIMFDNKKKFQQFMEDNFIDLIPNQINEINNDIYPFVFKFAYGNAGSGVEIIFNNI
jgi:hypothetical protein